jgi:hypothetical protein
MTFFDTDNIPDEIHAEPLGAQHFDTAMTVIKDAVDRGEVAAYEAKAAFVYERRNWLETDPIVGRRNESYNTELDDILVQVTVRIPRTELFNKFEKTLQEEHELKQEEAAAAEIAKIEAEEAALAARKAAAQARLKK